MSESGVRARVSESGARARVISEGGDHSAVGDEVEDNLEQRCFERDVNFGHRPQRA